MERITLVLKSGMGMQLDAIRPYLRPGMPIAIGRAGAVIAEVAEGNAIEDKRQAAEAAAGYIDSVERYVESANTLDGAVSGLESTLQSIEQYAEDGQNGSALQAMNALRVIRETVAKHLVGAEAAEEHPLERAVLALRTIAEFPCPEQDNMPAANMRQIALAALSGAGASSEPGNPGGEPVSGPGNAGERPHPAPGSGDSELAESLQTLVRWLDRVAIEDGYVGVPVIEAVEVVVNEMRRLQAEVADWQEAAGRSRSDVMAYIAERAKLLEEHDVALAEVGALKAELQSQRERNTELIFKLGSATNGWGRCEKERDAALAEVELLRQFERICEGLPQDAIDGGWTVQGIRGYAKRLEDQLKTALGQHNVPSGWKLVPLEPTPEMLDARRDSEDGMDGYLVEDTEYYFPDRGAVRDFLACVYRGLLAAAPAPGGER
ncbi:hypothetical protein [Pseudomonas aeruginosa]|uniref:hypothetical protein n=6 Tax=Pseudomonas aeruginosa TaxID=287 RepID=UPI002364354F|nr:hypothetical protein [Pseudomonas aeruginosa]MDD1857638.1 hypothetical protein [Pseudomonas aeruginosa]HDY6130802.1 hypothetical protein [Pseudomonas aeruginosa]